MFRFFASNDLLIPSEQYKKVKSLLSSIVKATPWYMLLTLNYRKSKLIATD